MYLKTCQRYRLSLTTIEDRSWPGPRCAVVVGDVEQCALVLAKKVLFDLGTVEFQKVHEDANRLLPFLTG
jgi:hypothetical protein